MLCRRWIHRAVTTRVMKAESLCLSCDGEWNKNRTYVLTKNHHQANYTKRFGGRFEPAFDFDLSSSGPVELNAVARYLVKASRWAAWWNTEEGDRNTGRLRDSERLEVGLASPQFAEWVFSMPVPPTPHLHLSRVYSGTDSASDCVCTCASLPCQIFSQMSGSELYIEAGTVKTEASLLM